MSVVLTVYSQNAYKEFVLPSIHNAEMKLHISAKMFRLRKDIELCLERMDNQWYLCASSDYIYENEGEKDAPVMLHHNALRFYLKKRLIHKINLGAPSAPNKPVNIGRLCPLSGWCGTYSGWQAPAVWVCPQPPAPACCQG